MLKSPTRAKRSTRIVSILQIPIAKAPAVPYSFPKYFPFLPYTIKSYGANSLDALIGRRYSAEKLRVLQI